MELMATARKYFRELELHRGFYRFMAAQEAALVGEDRHRSVAVAFAKSKT